MELTMRRSILLLTLLIASAMPLRAQVLECLGGKPLPCRNYLVYDAIVAKQVGGNMRNHEDVDDDYNLVMRDNSLYTGLEVGVMRNLGRSTALGATIAYDVDDSMRGRVALKARGRRWLSPLATEDIAGGVVGETVYAPAGLQSSCGTCTESGYGLTADATIGHRLLGVTFGADVVHAYGRQLTSIRAGGRAGGYLGIGATALVVIVVGAAMGSVY